MTESEYKGILKRVLIRSLKSMPQLTDLKRYLMEF